MEQKKITQLRLKYTRSNKISQRVIKELKKFLIQIVKTFKYFTYHNHFLLMRNMFAFIRFPDQLLFVKFVRYLYVERFSRPEHF